MKKLTFFLLVTVLLVSGCGKQENKQEIIESTDNQVSTTTTGVVKEFSMIAKNWEFEPSQITVDKGDTVRLKIKSIDVKHGFSIPEFNVQTDLIPNQETVVEFTADKSGTFTFFCSVYCGSGHGNMNGVLIVK